MDNPTTLHQLVLSLFGYSTEEFEDLDLNFIDNGVWDITEIPRLVMPVGSHVELSNLQVAQVRKFISTHQADEVVTVEINNHVYFFAWTPSKLPNFMSPMILDCPREILIVNN